MPTESESGTIEKKKHIVILVHGIRTRAHWIYKLKETLKANDFIPVATSYGRFNLLRFLFPGTFLRTKAIDRVTRDIRTAISIHNPDKISIIAHSFGTYVTTHIIANSPEIKLNKIIFCGSVVNEDFPFFQYSNRFAPPLLNEVGSRDYLPALAESAGWGYGSIGANGLNDPLAETRWHRDLNHSDFLTKEFCQKYWIPFLRNGTIIPGDDPTEISQAIQYLVMFPLRYVILCLAFLSIGYLLIQLYDKTPMTIFDTVFSRSCPDEKAQYPESDLSRVSKFEYDAHDPNDRHVNRWNRPTTDRWVEKDGNGESLFSIYKRVHFGICDRTIVKKLSDPNLELLISDKNCPDSALLFRRRPDCNWKGLPRMQNVE